MSCVAGGAASVQALALASLFPRPAHGTLWKGTHGARLAVSPQEVSHAGPHPRGSRGHGEREVAHPTASDTSPAAGEEQMQRGREPLSRLFTACNFGR